ncbi:MAG: tRNA (cytidine(34)-2'-O)-methyltransferase [Spirochaetales bacterium]
MLRIALVHPEIPQNTGNIARTCAAIGAELHLVHPLGFSVDERSVRRAGLDYWELLTIVEHASADEFLKDASTRPMFLFTSKGSVPFADISYPRDAMLVFGSETSGLSSEFMTKAAGERLRIPTLAEARCLNLSNAVAVAAYEVLRQSGFSDLELSRATKLE